jgi:hypothetical protein
MDEQEQVNFKKKEWKVKVFEFGNPGIFFYRDLGETIPNYISVLFGCTDAI